MIFPVDYYNQAVARSALLREWLRPNDEPSFLSQIGLFPQLDISFGDLGTNLPARLGASLRGSVDSIGRELARDLAGYVAGSVSYLEGFLNFRFSWDELLQFQAQSLAMDSERTIIVGLQPPSCSKLGYARVISRAMAQQSLGRLVGKPRAIVSAAGKLASSADSSSRISWFQNSLRTSRGESSKVRARFLEDQIGKNEVVTIWIAHDTLSRRDFRDIAGRRSESTITRSIVTVDRDDLKIAEDAKDIEALDSIVADQLSALVLHLASARSGHDIDILSARLAESSNLPWFARSVMDRLIRGVGQDCDFFLARTIRVREILLMSAISFHLDRGAIPEALTAIDGFLRSIMRALNQPISSPVRMTINQPNLYLSSAPRLIMDIIGAWTGG